MPNENAAKLAVPFDMQGLKDAGAVAFLQKEADGFPITVAVRANFYQYHSIGSPPSVESDSCFYDVMPGQQRHWLRFDRGERYAHHFKRGFEYMLEASDFVSICRTQR